jgi:hypothetical protein
VVTTVYAVAVIVGSSRCASTRRSTGLPVTVAVSPVLRYVTTTPVLAVDVREAGDYQTPSTASCGLKLLYPFPRVRRPKLLRCFARA